MNYTYYKRYKQPQRRDSSFSSFFWLIVFLLILVFAFKACLNFFTNLSEDKKDEAILTLDKGQAEITVFGADEPEKAVTSQLVLEGDKIRTLDDSYVTLAFYDGMDIRLDQNTTLSFSKVEDNFIVLDLIDGRAFVDELPSEDGKMELKFQTDVMNVISYEGKYLLSNLPNNEYIYAFEKKISVEFVDRSSGEDVVVEKATLQPNQKVQMNDAKQKDLLGRLPVNLVEDSLEDDLLTDDFYKWNFGSLTLLAEDEPTQLEEDIVESSTGMVEEPLQDINVDSSTGLSVKIKVLSPEPNTTITKDAFAIEGEILSGDPVKVTVTWDGNNSPYTLAGFGAGDKSFRYVADLDYKNFKEGANKYTVVAYDAAGNASNSITISVTYKATNI